jgi:uncharacterized protein YbjT (DUF2867 family)
MKIVVIGGTGLIGSKLVEKLREAGHDSLPASPDTGVNALTGEGLDEALAGAGVVVDVSNAPAWEDAAVLDFFQTSSRNLRDAETKAGVGHHVALSVVGTDRLPASGYFRAKVAQEEAVKAASIPYTILRATQFFEFIGRIADSSADGDTVRLAPVLVQPEAADDVAAALADIATSPPLNDTVELAGPEPFRLDELARRVLSANNDPRRVTADVHARYFGAELDDHSLTPGDNPRIGPDPLRGPAQPVHGKANVMSSSGSSPGEPRRRIGARVRVFAPAGPGRSPRGARGRGRGLPEVRRERPLGRRHDPGVLRRRGLAREAGEGGADARKPPSSQLKERTHGDRTNGMRSERWARASWVGSARSSAVTSPTIVIPAMAGGSPSATPRELMAL